MKTRYILLYAAAFLVLSALICGRILGMDQAGELPQYTTEINRLLVKLSENWEELPGAQLPEEDFDYTLIGSDGELIFATREGLSESISAATGHYDVIRDVERDGQILGRLIVYNDYEELQKAGRKKAAAMVGGMSLLMLAASAGYFAFLKRRVVAPFGRLKGFAERVAGGDLETPLEMDRSNIFGAFTESFDIMREELKASRQREEAAVRSRKEMIAELSHDIKTPVSSIKAMVDFLELTTENEAQKETLASINSKADRIDKLVSNLFHATLEELEQLEVRTEELSSRELTQIIMEADHLKMVSRLDVQDCVIMADRLRLEQIIGNIISNSYKYAHTPMTVNSRFEGNCLLVELSDKGGGVPEDEIELVTEKFRRGSNSQGKEGSGIGLYISNYLMNRMGGQLSCRNNGEGFTVELRFILA
ncbi:MAG: HAMP domain-containing histidine kinase [Ruminococcus sp.]|nr:HAMP domain-containing histidine kinase [Ruminococcus sp.]MBQ8121774.1 HAMP domain-containing histidine kinase [Ruminococcus sp.]HOO06854.1 HAMP domain-containing sensor histidine kinase [Ruminococcus sp.]HOR21262.1 HAMP domain-containing sensor histidine kinase [Ruminococcus sp.]